MSFFFLFYPQPLIQGVSATGGAGSLGIEVDTPLASIAGTGLAGSVDVDEARSLVGVAASGQASSPSIEVDASSNSATASGHAASPVIEIDGTLPGSVSSGQAGTISDQVAVTFGGTSGTGQTASLSIEVDQTASATGAVGTGQFGSPSIEIDNSLSSIAAVGQVASPVILIDEIALAVSGAGQAGLPVTDINVSSAAVGSGQAGSPHIEVDQTASIAGAVGTSQFGSLVITIDGTLPGVVGAGQAGAPIIEFDETMSIAGVIGTTQAGSPKTEVDTALNGGTTIGQAGSLAIEIDGTLLGAVGTGQAESPNFEGFRQAIIAGVGGTAQAGSLSIEIDVSLAGVAAAGSAGTITPVAGDAVIVVSLYSDNAGVPGTFIATIGSFASSEIGASPSTIALEPSPPISLTQNTRYWIQVTNTLTTSVEWVTLDNDGGVGVSTEFWYKSTGDSGSNTDGPAYLMAVYVEETAGISGVEATGSVGLIETSPDSNAQIIVSLYSDDSGVPGDFIAIIGSFPANEIGFAPTTIALSPESPIDLTANTRYWVQVVNTFTTTVQWVTLANDGGPGVSTEFWYTSGGDSGANTDGTVYQMAVLVEENVGLTGVEGVGGVGTVSTTTHSGRTLKPRSGRGSPYKAPTYTEPCDTEPLADKMARWREVVADALELPDKDEEVVEAAAPKPDFSFLSQLDTITQPRVDAEPIASIVQKSRYQMLAEAEDAIVLGVSEDDDFQLGLLTL